ncbi:hypothetical protein WS90_25215 [Burkholderia cepacia]|uniref:Type III secretion protein HrpB4 n=1 Tax=Burkholderia cepacia TaxID=292 RepID=A0A118KEL7_BURCE|nr:type III secretion protein HrpB4 [Burkholderia cepacia]KVK75947.1 hypothetical protein WS90_25215 [Burkholderia cepacia]
MDALDSVCPDGRAAWLARIAHAWRARVIERAARLEPAAARAYFGLPCGAWRRAGCAARRAWLTAAVGAVAPPVDAFDVPAARLALLTRAELGRALLARALFARADALRRCIDAARLDAFDAYAGAGFARRLLSASVDMGAATVVEPLLDDGPMSAWIHDGWRRICIEPDLDPRAAALIAPALPLDGAANDACVPDDALGAIFFSRLPQLFPELTWLFGCETMKAAWASTAT